MKDVIYRQDAINAVCKACYIADDGDYSECEAYNRPDDDWCEELVALRDVPSAEPERKKGKWIGYKDDDPQWKRDDGSPIFLICSECHETVLNNGSAHWNFCPHCGSYNGGEQE